MAAVSHSYLLDHASLSLQDLFYRIQECTFGDDCHCESFVTKEGETWKNVYVNALKQLRFDRPPEVPFHIPSLIVGIQHSLLTHLDIYFDS